MPRVCWSDKAEESLLAIGRHIIEQTQSRQRGLDVIAKIEEKCSRYADHAQSAVGGLARRMAAG